MKRRLCSVLLCCVMLLGLLPTVAGAEDGLTEGGTYYFDLSGAGIPGSINSNLVRSTLHYVPFTYVGEINAYKLTSADTTQNDYAHHLFIANYAVMQDVSWDMLNGNDLIFGRDYTSNGATYTMRAPSVGNLYFRGQDGSKHIEPENNEWDMILQQNSIKNDAWSWGQDTARNDTTKRACRYSYNFTTSTTSDFRGFRPVLEIPDPADLKVVTLNLNGGYIDGLTDKTPKIVVEKDGTFTAPVLKGLIQPKHHNTNNFKWKADNGETYAPGVSVPATVNSLAAQFTPSTYEVKLHTNGGTIAEGKNITKYTYGVGAKLPTADDMTYAGHTFEGWYRNRNLVGNPVTEISTKDNNYKDFWAKWVANTYNVTLDANGGIIAEGKDVTEYTYGASVTLPTDVTKTGYDFLGWYSGDEKVTSIGTSDIGDKSFIAKWQASTYTVTLHTNDGTINSDNVTEYTYGEGATLPTEVTRRGYTFKGWYNNEELTGDPVTAIGDTETGHKEYWAKWEANRYYYNRQPQKTAPVTSPGTADNSAMGLWGFLLCASLAVGYAVTAAQRRRKDAR